MKTSRLFPALAVVGAVASFAGNAVADTTLLDANTLTWDVPLIGLASNTVNGVLFEAAGGSGKFTKGAGIAGFTGFGVGDGTPNEIDIGETITLSWGSFDPIASFAVALLFDGPEWGDVHEVVQVTAFNSGNSTFESGTLTVTGANSADWSFNSQTISAISVPAQATDTGAGAWRVLNPFGGLKYDKLVFGALTGACTNPSCYSESDYALMEVTVVPEPQVFALMLAGLGAIGFVASRRRRQI